jgi:putative transcriptional regulator
MNRSFTGFSVMLACLGLLLGGTASAQGLLLVAKPNMLDGNFNETVVVVTQDINGAALGVIINRPTPQSLAGLLPNNEKLKRFTDPLYFGGPVEEGGLFAVYQVDGPGQGDMKLGQAYALLPGVNLALHPEAVETLMEKPPAKIRFYAGYAGWQPGQLRAEIERGAWYVMDADATTLFRSDTSKLWSELIGRMRSVTASVAPDAREETGWKALPVGKTGVSPRLLGAR